MDRLDARTEWARWLGKAVPAGIAVLFAAGDVTAGPALAATPPTRPGRANDEPGGTHRALPGGDRPVAPGRSRRH